MRQFDECIDTSELWPLFEMIEGYWEWQGFAPILEILNRG